MNTRKSWAEKAVGPGEEQLKLDLLSRPAPPSTPDGKRRERKLAYLREYYRRNAAKMKASATLWNRNNPVKRQQIQKASGKRNRAKRTARTRYKRRTNLNTRLLSSLRHRVWSALKRQRTHKNNTTIHLIGCSIPELRAHLESFFQPGMTWKNYGEWHVDHHVPCARFNLTDEHQQRVCFHYTNLRPLWAEANRIKSAKYAEEV